MVVSHASPPPRVIATPRPDRAIPLLIALATAALYFYRLNDTPMFVGGDEAFFGIHGRAIAATARDLDGRFLPLFFRIDAHTWYQPVLKRQRQAVAGPDRRDRCSGRQPVRNWALSTRIFQNSTARVARSFEPWTARRANRQYVSLNTNQAVIGPVNKRHERLSYHYA